MPYETVEMEIHVSELRLGMHVIKLDKPWEETDFLLQGFVIHNREEIDALQAQCERVFIEGKIKQQQPESERKETKKAMSLFAKVTSRNTQDETEVKQKTQNHRIQRAPFRR